MAGLSLQGNDFRHIDFGRPIAMGFSVNSRSHQEFWIVGKVDAAKFSLMEVIEFERPQDSKMVEDRFQAEVSVWADVQIWRDIAAGGMDGFLRAADEKKISISGNLPYFIRHVRSIAALSVAFSQALAHAEDQLRNTH